ncbi:MAG: ATP synthase subunit I [Nitrospinota bacterium]
MDLSSIIAIRAFTITLFTALITGILYSAPDAVSVLAGGLLAVTNFRLMARFLKRTIVPGLEPARGRALGMTSFFLRYALLGAVLLVVIRLISSPVFFIIGLTSVVAAVFASYKDIMVVAR